MRRSYLLPLCFIGLTACQTNTQQPFDVVLYHISKEESLKAQQQFHSSIDAATYAAFEYSDKLSGCDFEPGEYEAAYKYYHIRLSKNEMAQLKRILKKCLPCGAVANPEDIPASEATQRVHLFRLNLYNDKELLATVYPGIDFDQCPPKVNFFWGEEPRKELKKLPSYTIYKQREAAAQREYAEQRQTCENEE